MDIHSFRYADSAMRFFGGTPSPAPFVLANAALDLWEKFSSERVQARIQYHLDRLCAAVSDEILVSPRTSGARGGAFVINPPDRAPLREALATQNIHCDERKEGFRFSVHAYTAEREIDGLIGALARLDM